MNLKGYRVLKSANHDIYKFVSDGKRGRIAKVIQFKQIENTNVYNLSLGDVDKETKRINDSVISDNGDMGKVLATVAFTVLLFMQTKPGAYVYAKGNTKAKTRLYRMGISNNYIEICKYLNVYGINNGFIELFRIGVDYDAFLVEKK